MAQKPSYDELAARVAALEAALQDVQALRERMDRTAWAPDGGTPRVVDPDGRTLDFVPAIQFLGGVTVDVQQQRAIVAAGGGGLAPFNPASASDPAFRTPIVDAADPALAHGLIDTLTIGTTRFLLFYVAEDVYAPAVFAALFQTADATSGAASSQLAVTAGAGAQGTGGVQVGNGAASALLDLEAGPTLGATMAVSDLLSDVQAAALVKASTGASGAGTADATAWVDAESEGGQASARLRANSSADEIRVEVETEDTDPAGVYVSVTGSGRQTLLDSDLGSSWVQYAQASGAAQQRVVRGPVSHTIAGALGAGATGSVTINTLGPNDDRVIWVSVKGPLGSEQIGWTFEDGPAANEFTLHYSNQGSVSIPAGSLTFLLCSFSGS